MADEKVEGAAQAQGEQKPGAQAAAEWKPPTREEWEATQKRAAEVEALRKEAAEKRIKAKEADEKAAAAEKQKAAEEGRWQDVLKAEKAEAEALRAKLAELEGKASRADKFESVLSAEVASLEAAVGEERAKTVAHLSLEDRLPVLKQFAALAGAKPHAPKPASGSPAGTRVNVNLSELTPDEIRDLPQEHKAALARQLFGGGARKTRGL